MAETARCRHHRRRPQRTGHRVLSRQGRIQAAGARTPPATRRRAITEEFHPGFRCSILAHSAGPLRPDIVRDMQLEKHGLKMHHARSRRHFAFARWPRAHSLQRRQKVAQEIAKFSQKDAARYPEFQQSLAKIGKVIGEALALAASEHR